VRQKVFRMDDIFINKLYQRHQECPECPSPQMVTEWFNALLGTLFPDISRSSARSPEIFRKQYADLVKQLEQILVLNGGAQYKPDVKAFFDQVPQILELLEMDVAALFQGDPAAKSRKEVIKSYPGFLAIASHRIAHLLYLLEIPLIPRIISEYVHGKTGIDIHPGAIIGNSFCIDHGTGVVIGETTEIGNHVKVYQGVTLGALSVDKKDAKKKRHPIIEDHVVIYSGATILGGKTRIGKSSIIGGNVWITASIPAGSKIYYHPGKNENVSMAQKATK
jgi:serine O-acetyltransferase